MGSGVLNSVLNIATMGANRQYQAQKEAATAQEKAQLMAYQQQQQALEQQKQASEIQRQLQERELEASEQAWNKGDKYAISQTRQDKADKNSSDLTKGSGNFVSTTKSSLGSDDEEFNQWY